MTKNTGKNGSLIITEVPISELKFAEYNPRQISPIQFEKLKNSIREFGFIQPVVINKDKTIIGGHQRVTAYHSIGGTTVPAIRVNLSKEKEMVLNLALNRISGEWDQEKLVEMLDQIQGGESFESGSIDLTGFETQEINDLINRMLPKDGKDKPDMDPEKRAEEIKKPKIEAGDLIKLGNHSVLCGDPTKVDDVSKLFGTSKADLVVTSPAYAITDKPATKDDELYVSRMETMRKAMYNCYQIMNKHRYICVNIAGESSINTPAHASMILEGVGFQFFRNIYWIKPMGTATKSLTLKYPFPRHYDPAIRTERIMIYVNELDGIMPDKAEIMVVYDKDRVLGDVRQDKSNKIPEHLLNQFISNVWYFAAETNMPKKLPAYPIALPRNCIQFFTIENENVYDPFMAVGTTLLAADICGRRAFGMERDERYCQVTAERYIEQKGKASDVTVHRGKETIAWSKL